jgi:hypothetical protein
MLRRHATVAVVASALAIAILFLIDFSSSFVARCLAGNDYSDNYGPCASNYTKSLHNGLIISGIDLVLRASPEILTAFATCAFAAFTFTLWRATNRQAGLTRDAIELGNKDFIATHRPRLKVRRIAVVGFRAHSRNEPLIPGAEINATLEIVNVGGSEATIIWSRYRVYFGKDDYSMVSHYVPPHALALAPVTLQAGQPLYFELVDRVSKDIAPSGTLINPVFGEGPWNMYVIGEIRYQDRTGVIRHIGFCREMHSDIRFRAVNDSEYEYED